MMVEKLISIGRAAKLLGVSIQTLRRWDQSGRFQSLRPTPSSKRFYRKSDIDLFLHDLIIEAKKWAMNEFPAKPAGDNYCETRDVFEGRLSRLQNELGKMAELENIFPLLVSVAGEIGNNSFDHNIGAWPDVPGIFFGHDLQRKRIVLADRGQGVLQTLRRVRPSLAPHEEALKVAFSEILSGRSPESRGNGLKFVKKVVTQNPMTLLFQSGNAELFLQQNEADPATDSDFHGCIAIIHYYFFLCSSP